MIDGKNFHEDLWLSRITRIDPGLQAAKDCTDARVLVIQKDERRTGARVFVRSGTVGDDPFIFVEVQAGWIGFDGGQ